MGCSTSEGHVFLCYTSLKISQLTYHIAVSTGRMYSRCVICLLLINTVACIAVEQEGNATDFFTILLPTDGFFTSYYGHKAFSLSSLLYVQRSIQNFSISVSSSEMNVATVEDTAVVVPCQEAINPNLTLAQMGLSDEINYKGNFSKLSACYQVSFSGSTVYIGYAHLRFSASLEENRENVYIGSVPLRVIRPYTLIDTVYNLSIMILVSVMMLATGNDLNLETIKENLKKPKAPVIALLSQFTIMPLIAYGIIWLMGYTGGKALGFFALGCSPGGGTSNMFAKLFNGDLSLSVTMTTLSTVVSLGMLPFWLYTLGATIPADGGADKIQIPFLNILQSLAFIVVPLAVGVLMKYKLERISRFIKKWLNVLFIIGLLFFFVFAIYAKFYIFAQWNAELMLAASLLPYGGFLFGGLLAWICRFDWTLIKTISIETGMQSVAVCILVVMSVSEQPDNDLAIILPMASTIVAGLPFYLIFPIYFLRQKISQKKKSRLTAEKCSIDLTDSEKDSKEHLCQIEAGETTAAADLIAETKLIHENK
ncbi:hepatic sodium/bile acid cotransporter-like [Watersipora subatra]|uniref:hepatic sodium/bile acid cotransporter-like n=1 Tax=Watersipora subatra TaxID=2589382 RepID=UPI00355B1736